jgi:hypothetical protein
MRATHRTTGVEPLRRGCLAALLLLALGACGRAQIPTRLEVAPTGFDPMTLLEGGTLLFEDDFEREALGAGWQSDHASWRLEQGWVTSTNPRNQGVWLDFELPPRARIELDLRSEPIPGKPFPGDLKCEAFGAKREHQAGYVLANGGWGNTLDIIARLDEHGRDRKEQPADPVEPSRTYHWAVVRAEGTIWWFKDRALHMRFPDEAPLPGTSFGLNNWEARSYFDNLKIYALP